MRIRVINSVRKKDITEGSMPGMPAFAEVEIDFLPDGPTSIECRVDRSRVEPLVLDRIIQADSDGVDGIVVNCFMDPAVEAARELVDIPVVGPAQSSMVLATTLGDRFSVILPAASGAAIASRQVRQNVGLDRLASIRSVEMPVSQLHDAERLTAGLVDAANRAIDEDGAEVIILGCTGMSYATDAARARLGGRGVPVLDPTLAAVGTVVSQLMQGVAPSRRAYAVPSWRLTGQGAA